MRTCTHCLEEKPVDKFDLVRIGSGKRHSWCRHCQSENKRNRNHAPLWDTVQVCSVCKRSFEGKCFYTDRARPNGLTSECRGCIKLARKANYKNRREEIIKRNAAYAKAHPEAVRLWASIGRKKRYDSDKVKDREYRLKVKIRTLSHYSGGDVKCACCGERHLIFLTLDHIDGRGNEDRAALGTKGAGVNFYRWLIKNNFPRKMQVLCWNCNAAKHYLGSCPHQVKNVASV